jgi:hypothetical protein
LRVAGLSIEGQHARVSIVGKKAGILKPIKSDEIKLPEDDAQRIPAMREALLKWKKDYGITHIVFGVDFRLFSHHYVELPLKAKNDIRRALPFELEKYLPLSPEEYVYDFLTVGSADGRTRNLVLAVRDKSIVWVKECLRETGLSLLGIRCAFIEALNEFLKQVKEDNVIFVYPEDGIYCIAGVKNSAPEILRTVRGEKAAGLELERLQAAFGKGIYVSGAKDASVFERMNTKGIALSVPNAIAMSALKRRPIKMDFRPGEMVEPKKQYHSAALWALGVFSVFLLFLTPAYSYFREYRMLEFIDNRIEEIKKTSRELLVLRRNLEEVKKKKAFLLKFQEEKNASISFLSEISKVLPPNAWLTALSIDEKGVIELNGFAQRAADIIEPLEKSPFFKNVAFSNPVTTKEGMERFSIKMLAAPPGEKGVTTPVEGVTTPVEGVTTPVEGVTTPVEKGAAAPGDKGVKAPQTQKGPISGPHAPTPAPIKRRYKAQ